MIVLFEFKNPKDSTETFRITNRSLYVKHEKESFWREAFSEDVVADISIGLVELVMQQKVKVIENEDSGK